MQRRLPIRIGLIPVLVLVLVPVLGGCRASKPAGVTVTMTEFAFDPNPLTIEGGEGQRIRIILQNKGTTAHSFVVRDLDVDSKELAPGQSKTIEFTSTNEGTFRFVCSLPGHEQVGMAGYVTIT